MKIVISGFYGFGNTGDEAILEATLDQLRSELDDPELTVFSISPETTGETHQVKSIYRGWRRDFLEKVKALKQADLLLSGGGGLLQDTYPNRFIFGPLPYYLLIVLLARLVGTKVMFFSHGIGPVNTRYGKLLMKLIANKVQLITVRDQESKDLLIELGVTKPKTIVTSDIVFAHRAHDDDTCYNQLPSDFSKNIIGVSMRPWFGMTTHYEEVAKGLDQLVDQGYCPVFIPMEGLHDVRASKHVQEKMIHAERTYILDHQYTPNQLLRFTGRCELVIGMRLHSLIFSTLMGTPHVGISYDPKVANLLRRNGMWEHSTDLHNISSEQLVSSSLRLLSDRDHWHELLLVEAKKIKEDAQKNISLLKENFLLQSN